MTARDDLAVSALARALVRTGMYVDAGIDTSAGLDKPQVYAAAILNDPDLAADGLHFVMVETLDRATLDAARAAAPAGELPLCPICGDYTANGVEVHEVCLPAPDPVAGLRDWAAARRGVADRWAKVADSYGKPASAVEVAAAVRYDDGYDLNNPNLPERYHRLLYDRRALLNVIAALLDSEPDGLDAAWAEIEALTKGGGWLVEFGRRDTIAPMHNPITDYPVKFPGHYFASASREFSSEEGPTEYGDTPAAALRALAARLSGDKP